MADPNTQKNRKEIDQILLPVCAPLEIPAAVRRRRGVALGDRRSYKQAQQDARKRREGGVIRIGAGSEWPARGWPGVLVAGVASGHRSGVRRRPEREAR